MPFSPQTLEEKPYNACINCAFMGKRCDGPNFLAMTLERWCEWCKVRKIHLGWSNADVIERSGISKNTVDRIMAGTITGLNAETMRAVTKALVNGTWGQYPCAMVSDNGMNAELEAQRLKEQHDSDQKKIDFLRDQIAFKEKQMLAKDEQIASKDKRLEERRDFIYRKDRIIGILGFLLGVCVLVIIAALVADAMNPDIGFFWRV